jgi:hypothetical protein
MTCKKPVFRKCNEGSVYRNSSRNPALAYTDTWNIAAAGIRRPYTFSRLARNRVSNTRFEAQVEESVGAAA